MLQDDFGHDVSTDDPGDILAINAFVQGFLRYQTSATRVLDAQGSACALVNVYCGVLFLFLESMDAPHRAEPHLARAEAAEQTLTDREAFSLSYARTWQSALQTGRYEALLALGEEAVHRFPGDLVLIKLHQYHCFNVGNAPAMLRAAQAAAKVWPGVAQVHGMLAFGYEQCHWLIEAEASARTALAFEKQEPWAQHALAHVMLTQGRMREGAAFLESVEATWEGLNSFMLTHLWWHRALFYLSLGRFDDALEIYDHHTLNAAPTYSQDQVGAVSLLARLEVSGLDVADRWEPLGDLLAARSDDVVQPLLSLQYLYGLAKAQRPEAESLLKAICSQSGATWTNVAAPVAQALCAYAASDFSTAYEGLVAALPRLMDVGGSHAQRDLFEQILLDTAMKSGHLVTAQQLIEKRLSFDPDGAVLKAKRRHVNAALGLIEPNA